MPSISPKDDNQLICVAPEYVQRVWPHVSRLIERAMIRGNADSGPDYIRKSLEAGRALLWVVWNGKDLMAAATTEIVNLDTVGKVCLITSCAGRDLRKWEKFLVDIEAYATTEGCDAVRFYGRPGWAHFLKKNGYDQPWFVMQKSLR